MGGAVGMRFAGGFALGMMLAERVPVVSQPSLPFSISPAHRALGRGQLRPTALASRWIDERELRGRRAETCRTRPRA